MKKIITWFNFYLKMFIYLFNYLSFIDKHKLIYHVCECETKTAILYIPQRIINIKLVIFITFYCADLYRSLHYFTHTYAIYVHKIHINKYYYTNIVKGSSHLTLYLYFEEKRLLIWHEVKHWHDTCNSFW